MTVVQRLGRQRTMPQTSTKQHSGGWPTHCAVSMDFAECKDVVLGLIFQGASRMHSRAKSVFRVPRKTRRQHLKAQDRQSTTGRLADVAMTGIECDIISSIRRIPIGGLLSQGRK
jgi:hypothetical protein